MNRRSFLFLGLLTLLALVVMAVPPMKDPSFVGYLNKPVAAAGGSACSTVEYLPSADTAVGTWTAGGGPTARWDCVDRLRAAHSTASWIQVNDHADTPCVLRFTLPGNCNVSAVTIYTWGSASSGTITMQVAVSQDNTTWTTANQSLTSTGQERSSAITGLSYTSPAYCYVRLDPTTDTWNDIVIYEVQIIVNP